MGRRTLIGRGRGRPAGRRCASRWPGSSTTWRPRRCGQLQRDYVETFDVTRRCCLYLTYFAHGDTRKRGLALVQFKQAYREAGVELDAAELPDHLCVVLEFGATVDAETAWRLLNDHRAGIEMLRIALAETGSPWHDALRRAVRDPARAPGRGRGRRARASSRRAHPPRRSGWTCSPTPSTPGSTRARRRLRRPRPRPSR